MIVGKVESVVISSLLMIVFIAGCGSKPESQSLVLKKFGPEEVKAGTIFNRQPNGESAIWAETENATPTTIFVLNGVHLESAVHPDGKAASAFVPKQSYEKPGEFILYLLDTKTNKKSNEMKFTVKP